MQSDFEIITDFLSRHDADVTGHSSDLPDNDVLVLFRKFANGKATPKERAEVVSLVDSRPNWIAALADEIKRRRERATSTAEP